MAGNAENQQYLAGLRGLRQEDRAFDWTTQREFLNRPESKQLHHQPLGFWAGELQAQYGAHRRGPNRRGY